MKCSNKKLAAIGAVLCVLGLLVALICLSIIEFDFTKLAGNRYTEETYAISDEISSINILADTADVEFIFSEDKKFRVVCSETEKLSYSVYVENGCLYVKPVSSVKWYDFIDLKNIFGTWGDNKVIVHLPHPQNDYKIDLKIETDTGDVKLLESMKFKNIDLKSCTGEIVLRALASEVVNAVTNTGDIILDTAEAFRFGVETDTGAVVLSSVTANNIKVNADTGDVTLENCEISGDISVETDTGDVTVRLTNVSDRMNITTNTGDVIFDRADAGKIYVTTNTGDVEGSLLSEMVFYVQTDTGKVNVPKITSADGLCEITTDTGDVSITIE